MGAAVFTTYVEAGACWVVEGGWWGPEAGGGKVTAGAGMTGGCTTDVIWPSDATAEVAAPSSLVGGSVVAPFFAAAASAGGAFAVFFSFGAGLPASFAAAACAFCRLNSSSCAPRAQTSRVQL